MKLAIITARGGSKRIPKKNIRLFCGKEIIAYSIEAALKSEVFGEVMVSTDSVEIAEVALKYGAKVPFLRSEKTSDDYATTSDVLVEVLEYYQEENYDIEQVCCIYPTAPFITANKIREAMQLLENDMEIDTVLPVVCFSYPPQRGLIEKNGKLLMREPEYSKTRSQDLQPLYHDAGQFYCLKVDSFLKTKNIMSGNIKGYILPETEVQDIDTEGDWKMAELKFGLISESKHNART